MQCRLTTLFSAALIVLATSGSPAAGQDIPVLSADARVSLITILPGQDVYSTFGHSALRVVDRQLGLDESYNYGTFDFGSSLDSIASFIGRFTYGDLNYRLTVQDTRRMVVFYWEELGRGSIEQTLALSAAETQDVFRFLRINARPENRYYQYDFFFDNCATRLVDALESALGSGLSFTAEAPNKSFRDLLDPYLAGVPWTGFGMNLGLGFPADRQATARETTFLPEWLMNHLATGRIERDGTPVPLVARTDTLTGGSDLSWAPEPTPPWPAIALWILFAAGGLLTLKGWKTGSRPHRWADSLLFGVLGIGGLVVVFLWFISLHTVTDANLNLAWALPTHVVVAIAIVRRPGERWLGRYMALTAVFAGILLLGMPLWPQRLPAAIVPLLLLILLRAAALSGFLPNRSA